MNFISRNLGWIMLFFFFLFMLFVISTNQKKDLTTGTGATQTGTILETWTGTEDETSELNTLIDKITNDEIEDPETMTGSQEDSESMTGSWEEGMDNEEKSDVEEETEPKKSFLDFFRKSAQEEPEETEETASGETIDEDTEAASDTQEMKEPTTQKSMTQSAPVKMSASANIVKNNVSHASVESQLNFTQVGEIHLPGLNLVTKVGKTFQVGVHSLKLNNKHFTQKLGFMMQWDSVQQLTAENAYGCFEIEILSSSRPNMIGKKGYVCKKYLMDLPVTETVSTETLSETGYYKVSPVKLFLNDAAFSQEKITTLDQGDILKATGTILTDGCFEVTVVGAKVQENHKKVWYVCPAYVSNYVSPE